MKSKIHKFDVMNKGSVCRKKGKYELEYEDVTCMDCLIVDEEEWSRQAMEFKHQPKKNAKKKLDVVRSRIAELTDSKEGGKSNG